MGAVSSDRRKAASQPSSSAESSVVPCLEKSAIHLPQLLLGLIFRRNVATITFYTYRLRMATRNKALGEVRQLLGTPGQYPRDAEISLPQDTRQNPAAAG